MKKSLIHFSLVILILTASCSQFETKSSANSGEEYAKNVTIIRDHYGVPHIYGKTDADCVFGLMYAQCEDDFARVERNYITMLGRSSEMNGEKDIYEDLLIRMTIDSAGAVEDFKNSPPWLQKLMIAYADGINYYLYKHPEVKPALITKFEPWYSLMYTDGSISAIQTAGIGANDIKAFYNSLDQATGSNVNDQGNRNLYAGKQTLNNEQLSGSNGFAIAPSKSASGKAMLYINPHVTFYFRPEVHMVSEEGLNVYGAVTWGQFFVYQGFNEHLGFMHTSSMADAADLYDETITKREGKYYYTYEGVQKPVSENKTVIRYVSNGKMESKTFTIYSTQHGPVMAEHEGKWTSLKTNNRSLNGLIQSWTRNKAESLNDFTTNLELRANLSNNTVYADDKGNIAYWHGNYMPKRDTAYNWNFPVDGTTSKTEWKGMHTVAEITQAVNPSSGWIQNCNGTPYSVSGASSPLAKNFPGYMAPDGENFRQINAVRVLSKKDKFTMDDLIAAGYDKHLTAFDTSLQYLFAAHEKIKSSHPLLYDSTKAAIDELKTWDHNMNATSVAQTLAIEWADRINALLRSEDPEYFVDFTTRYGKVLRQSAPEKLVRPLSDLMQKLTTDFGKWQIPWGELNRMQRISNKIEWEFNDTRASLPMSNASSTWGALPSFNSRYFPGTKKRYGYGGNSFICVVEFGDKVRAKSLLAGGESGNPASKHFFDQSEMYTKGKFKEVHFYREDVLKNAEKTYRPGE